MWHHLGAMRKLTPKRIPNKPSTPWMVRIPKAFVLADPDTGKKRDERKFFAHRPEALDYINRLFTLGKAKADWRMVEDGNVPLSLPQCVSSFLLRYRPEQMVNNRTLVQERQILKAFVKRYGKTAINSFTHREIDSWLRGLDKAPQTIQNHFAIVRRFFNWCAKEELIIGRNPIARAEKPKVPYTFPTTITPQEMGTFLAAAKQLPDEHDRQHMVAYLCIGGFAGLRTSEIKRLRWEDIAWQNGQTGRINVLKSKRGMPRSVTIQPALRRHLEPFALESGPVFSLSSQAETDLRVELEKLAGIELPHNCLRHSFASYHIAKWESYEQTAFQMGHTSPRVTRAKYIVVKDQAAAEQWWAL
jgi:integrase